MLFHYGTGGRAVILRWNIAIAQQLGYGAAYDNTGENMRPYAP